MGLTLVNKSKYLTKKLLAEIAEEVFSYLGEDYSVGLRFVSNKEIQEFNEKYRGFNQPTNVLSFSEEPGGRGGDILISEEYLETESSGSGYRPEELEMLYFVHGLFHLAGYDHQNPAERDKMEGAESKILKKFGINIER